MLKQFDARITKLFYDFNCTISRSIIGDNDLEILKCLIQDALNTFLNKFFVVVRRNNYTYQRHYFFISLIISQIFSTSSSFKLPYSGIQRTSLTTLCATGKFAGLADGKCL